MNSFRVHRRSSFRQVADLRGWIHIIAIVAVVVVVVRLVWSLIGTLSIRKTCIYFILLMNERTKKKEIIPLHLNVLIKARVSI